MLKRIINVKNYIVFGLFVGLASIIYEGIFILFKLGVLNIELNLNMIEIIAILSLYNTIIAFAIYPLVKIIGDKYNIIFKKNNILTRYF